MIIRIDDRLFRQKWFRELTPNRKMLWLFLLCESNHIGAFDIDCAAWEFHTGAKFGPNEPFTAFGDRCVRLSGHDKGLLVDKLFYQGQYVKGTPFARIVDTECAAVGLSVDALHKMSGKPFAGDDGASVAEPPPAFAAPSVDDVTKYIREGGLSVDPVRFHEYYTARGWAIKGQPMRDWRAAVRFWATNQKRDEVRRAPSQPVRKIF